jgi:hypothetical protein
LDCVIRGRPLLDHSQLDFDTHLAGSLSHVIEQHIPTPQPLDTPSFLLSIQPCRNTPVVQSSSLSSTKVNEIHLIPRYLLLTIPPYYLVIRCQTLLPVLCVFSCNNWHDILVFSLLKIARYFMMYVNIQPSDSPLELGQVVNIKKACSNKVPVEHHKQYLEIVHCDIGFGDCMSIGNGALYCLILVDWATRYSWIHPLKSLHHDSILTPFQQYIMRCSEQLSKSKWSCGKGLANCYQYAICLYHRYAKAKEFLVLVPLSLNTGHELFSMYCLWCFYHSS